MGGRPVRRAAALLALLPAFTPLRAQAQDGEPIVLSPQPPLEWFHFYDLDLALELEWRANITERDSATLPSTRDVQNRVREILDARTTGFVGHPNLLELDLGGRFWFEQLWQDFDSTGTDQFIGQTLLNWDVSGLLIKESSFPITIYSRQNTTTIDQQFGGSLENTFSETGGRVNLRDQVFPTNFQVFYRKILQDNPAAAQDFKLDQFTVQADGRVEMSQDQRLAWDLKWDNVHQTGNLFVPNSFNRLEGNATHTFEFGEQDRNILRTQLRVFNETGQLDFTQIRLDPRLRLVHSDDLNSWYDYTFEYDQRTGQEQLVNRGTANVQYQLFDSLMIIGNAGFNLLDIPTQDFDSAEIFGRGDVQYTKEVPLGLLNANLNGFVSWVDQSPQGAPVQLTNQIFTFSVANTFTINQRNVVASSIIITGLGGVPTYMLGTDYTVQTFADSTQVTRLISGSIPAPPVSVQVSYVIGPDPGGTTFVEGVGLEGRYTFEEGILTGLSAYANVFLQNEARPVGNDENDFTDLRYGVEYSVWKLYFKAEREHRFSDFSPFEATRLEARYTETLGRGSTVVLSALYQDLDRQNEGVRTRTATLSGQWAQLIGDNLQLSLLLQYQWSDDTVALQSQGFEGQFDLSWRYRQTEIYAQVRGTLNDSSTADDTSFQRFIVGFRREF